MIRNWTKMEQILKKIEQKLNENWGGTIKDRLRVPGMYGPGTLNWAFIVFTQFPFNFLSNSVRFLFNFCSNPIQLFWIWMEIEKDIKKQMSWPYIRVHFKLSTFCFDLKPVNFYLKITERANTIRSEIDHGRFLIDWNKISYNIILPFKNKITIQGAAIISSLPILRSRGGE